MKGVGDSALRNISGLGRAKFSEAPSVNKGVTGGGVAWIENVGEGGWIKVKDTVL